MFSHGSPSAAIPTRLSIQNTTNEALPYALAFAAGTVCGDGEFENGISNANAANE